MTTILLVDDDETFRRGLATHLTQDGHRVLDFAAAVHVPSPDLIDPDVAVVITDFQMPQENGIHFADRYHQAHPDIPVILITAHCSEEMIRQAERRTFIHVLHKPVDYFELQELIQTVLHRSPSS